MWTLEQARSATTCTPFEGSNTAVTPKRAPFRYPTPLKYHCGAINAVQLSEARIKKVIDEINVDIGKEGMLYNNERKKSGLLKKRN